MIESNIIHQAYVNKVKKLMFFGSSCIYPKLAPQPLKEDYLLNKHKWFPRDDTKENAKFDKRTPGLFKVEYTGKSFVGLCPKLYFVEGADNSDEERFSPGERYGRVYQINYLRCVFCGLCIEACPTRALTMTNEYELADDSRAKLIFEKQDLLAPLRQGMLMPPHPMYPDMTDTNYYNGDVKGAHPSQAKNPGDIQS